MINIAVCDDDKYVTSEIENLLIKIAKGNCIKINVDIYYDGSTLEKAILNGEKYDLLYLDIEMEQDGIATALSLRDKGVRALIIYISNHEKYLKRLFDVGVFRFLNKPIDEELFKKYFLIAKDLIDKDEELFVYQFRRMTYKVEVGNIMYFESKLRKISIYLVKSDPLTYYGTLSEVEEYFEDVQIPFIRTHQSFLVNYKYIRGCRKNEIELCDGTCIPISEDRQKKVERKYVRLLGKDIFNE